MFVTLVRENNQLAALVHYEDSRVDIASKQDRINSLLKDIYTDNMTPTEFAKANYQLNRYRPLGITWELMLSQEFKDCGH